MRDLLIIVRLDSKYCDYLRKFDNKVSYNKFEKQLRPFIGILFQIDTCEYFAPLSSPKLKHKNMKNTVDFFKIKDGELGAVNFNNMIPVNENNYSLVDLNKETLTIAELKYQKLLREQLEEVMNTLTPREAKVLKLRFGLEDGKARTLEEVGREFEVTRERIRQIEAKALRKLRHPSRSKKLRDYMG